MIVGDGVDSLATDATMDSSVPRPTFKTPRPLPVIVAENSFSHKKKGTSRYSPPKPPAKSAPPISRVFRQTRKSASLPQAVSFRERSSSIESPHYNSDLHVSFFEQCFKVLNKLGAGSFGEAFKVESKEDGKMYAVKKSRARFRGDFDRKQKLEEVHKHEQIQGSKNCVKFYRAWEERQFLFIQAELCEMSLKDYAEKVGFIREDEIWNIIVDLTMGLKHLHDHDFVHMDIKPANLFLGLDGYYKIGDFGLALDVSKPNYTSEAQEGDPKYLAPELMQGAFAKAADIFSLGITILELACFIELPRGGDLWQELRDGKLPAEFTRGLSPSLLNLIEKMMSRDAKERPTVDEVLDNSDVKKVVKKRNMFWVTSKFQQVGSLLTRFILRIIHFLIMLLFLPKTFIVKAPKTSTPRRKLPPSDLDSTFPHSSDSSLSFNGHESIFNNSSENAAWYIPSPRRTIYRDSSHLQSNPEDRPVTPVFKLPSIIDSSPELGSSPTSSLNGSLRVSPIFNPPKNPHLTGTPISEKMPRTRLFVDDDLDDFNPKSLLKNFQEAADQSF